MATWTTPVTWTNGAVTAAAMNSLRDNLNWLKDLLTDAASIDSTVSPIRIRRSLYTDTAYEVWQGANAFAALSITPGSIKFGSGAAAVDVQLGRLAASVLQIKHPTTPSSDVQFYIGTAIPGAGTAYPLRIVAGTDSYERIGFALPSTGLARLNFGGGVVSPDLWLARNAAGRLQVEATADHARIGSLLNDTSSEANSVYVWAAADTVPRVSIGQTTDGFPRLALGAGSGTQDIEVVRVSARVAAVRDAQWRVLRDAATNPALSIRTTGDTTDAFAVAAAGYADMREQAAPIAPAVDNGRLYCEDNGVGKTRLMVKFNTGVAQVIATQP